MNLGDDRRVECGRHGSEAPAFVCRHLNLETAVGFVEGYDPDDPDTPLYQAWCSECDDVLMRVGEWNDESEAFAGVRMVCRGCYEEMKRLNGR